MINEKIKYYRKKNMLTQEELARKLHVSRQIITKWEAGIVIPGLEYIIDLANIFSITIDTLVKDDDCKLLEDKNLDYLLLREFLIQAKKETYANKKGKTLSSRKQSHDYFYEKNNFKYLDSYFGSSHFSGEEIVYENDQPIWSMNYYGKVLNDNFNGDFLKAALKKVPIDHPYRGPESYGKGDFHYFNIFNGDIDFFLGKEEIFYQDIKVYEGYYHGGIIL